MATMDTEWINEDVKVDAEGRCPIHGDNGVGNCWPCHVAACDYADAGDIDEDADE